jgi:hypothetical protein
MRNTADVTGGKLFSVRVQSISGVTAINLKDAIYDIHGRKGEVLFFCYVPDTTRERRMTRVVTGCNHTSSSAHPTAGHRPLQLLTISAISLLVLKPVIMRAIAPPAWKYQTQI